MIRARIWGPICALWAGIAIGFCAAAQTPITPPAGASVTAEITDPGAITLPAGVWRDGAVPTIELDGPVVRRAWRIDGVTDPAAILDPLRRQIEAAGWEIVFACSARACGGFDFRFAMEVIPAPEMIVDLGAYRYLLARNGSGGTLALLASRARSAGYLQITSAAGPSSPADGVGPEVQPADTPDPGDLVARLRADGRVALDDLRFETGSAALGAGPFRSVADLADALVAEEDLRVVLVGHTDADGPLAPNVALSRRRAGAVRDRLVETYGVDPDRITAEGVGFLAPRASNATEDGRRANRRVEAVLAE